VLDTVLDATSPVTVDGADALAEIDVVKDPVVEKAVVRDAV
jgi:hypothetical protein